MGESGDSQSVHQREEETSHASEYKVLFQSCNSAALTHSHTEHILQILLNLFLFYLEISHSIRKCTINKFVG